MFLSCHQRRLAVFCLFCATLHARAGSVPVPPLPKHPHYAIQHFGERNGLGSATVLSMAQDQQGFLWVGTQTGLFRYDGSGVTRFGRTDGLPGELVELIVVGPDGNLWVRARKGIALWVRERFEAVALPEEAGALRDTYQSFAVDSAGTLFIATQKGLLRLSPGTKKYSLFPTGNTAHPAAVDGIVRAPDDTIWFASGGQIGRIRHGQASTEIVASLDKLGGEEQVIALLPAPDGRLWVRTSMRIGALDAKVPARGITWVHGNLPGANLMGGPSLDRRGSLLLPTDQGLYWRDGNQWRRIDHKSGLTSNAVSSVLEDREGGIWVGTTGTGLDYWPGSQQWSGWTDEEGLPDALVLGVVRDHRQRLWVATNTALAVWDPTQDQWRTWTEGGARGGVNRVGITPDGAVWALFPGKGIFRFEANLEHPKAELVPTGDWKPQSMAAAPDNSVWVDGKDRLHVIRYDNGRFTISELHGPHDNAGTSRNVSVSPGGVVWSAGPNGVSRYSQGHWQHFGQHEGMLADKVIDIQAVRDNEVWLEYPDEGQMTRLRLSASGSPEFLNVKKGMCVLGMDRRHNVWAEMEEGVGMISPDGSVRTFTQSDGLIWNDVNCGSLWQESDGSILFGTSKGLARYDVSQEEPALRPPSVVLTAATFARQERLKEKTPQILNQDATLVARFAAPVFHDPDRITCRYQLAGLETDFTETSLREARYSSLPAGDYSFQVSCGSAQLGQSAVASYPFTVLPPWWESWWARTSGMLLFGLAISGVLWSQQERDRREKVRLEQAVEERSAELARVNRDLEEASLSDPLTGVRNRRFFQSTIPADASQSIRAYRTGSDQYSHDHRDLVFFLVDIDHFKEVNDRYGHDAGDLVLVEIAQRLNSVVRESDFLIRWGGEEFLVVCRSAEREDAPHMAERILQAISYPALDLGLERRLRRTCSVGWAPFPWLPPASADLSVDEVLRLADRGLYLAKQNGRNQAIGLVPSSLMPTRPDKHFRLEQLLEDGLIREIRTPGVKAAVAGSA